MDSPFLAVAVDFDGTLTTGARPRRAVLEAIHKARREGRRVILATGRILADLRRDYPDVDEQFDLIVAENGAVLARGDDVRELVPQVAPELAGALAHRDIPVRQGRVLLACDAQDAAVVLEEVNRLGLDCQLVRNRGKLMVLPAGVTKGTGLIEGLGDLGISRHSTVAVGDAENDHHMIDVCEIGVAVGNAVPALKRHADVVLDQPDGDGVARFLDGPVLHGERRVHPWRWQVELGVTAENRPVMIPASQVNVLITGGSRSGKSYTAGLITERLVAMDYSVLVFDLEGDHTDLGRLRGMLTVGTVDRLPAPAALPALLGHRFGSVVVDLARLGAKERRAYMSAATEQIGRQRAVTGLPHWIVTDEAHLTDACDSAADDHAPASSKGHCLVTYRPGELAAHVLDGIDVMIATLGGGQEADRLPDKVAAFTGLPRDAVLDYLGDATPGQALIIDRGDAGTITRFTVAARRTAHVRHWHKYLDGALPERSRFYFRDGSIAANINEFYRHLRFCDASVIAHHTRRGNFSRWIADVLQDQALATPVHEVEQQVATHGDHDIDMTRREILAVIRARYIG